MSYLIHNSVILFFIAALLSCASTQRRSTSSLKERDFDELKRPKQWLVSKSDSKIDANLGDEESEQRAAQQVRRTYCLSLKQKMPLRITVMAISPKPPKGTPVDEANDLVTNVMDSYRESFRTLFYELGNERRAAHQLNFPYWGQNNSNADFFGIESKETKQLVGMFKNHVSKHDPRSYQNRDPLYNLVLPTTRAPVLFAVPGHIPKYVGLEIENDLKTHYSTFENGQAVVITDPREGELESKQLLIATDEAFTLEISNDFDKFLNMFGHFTRKPDKERLAQGPDRIATVYPLVPGILMDSYLLTKHFTFIAPSDQLTKVFGDRVRIIMSKDDPTVSDVLQQREKLWERYVSNLTTVKEATTDDPRVIKFDVSLDLGPFCAYVQNFH